MGIILALIIGGIIGWLAAAVTGRNEGILGSIAIGVVGAIIGSIIANLLGNAGGSLVSSSWSGIFWTFVGALILSGLLNALQSGGRGHNNV